MFDPVALVACLYQESVFSHEIVIRTKHSINLNQSEKKNREYAFNQSCVGANRKLATYDALVFQICSRQSLTVCIWWYFSRSFLCLWIPSSYSWVKNIFKFFEERKVPTKLCLFSMEFAFLVTGLRRNPRRPYSRTQSRNKKNTYMNTYISHIINIYISTYIYGIST